VRGNNVARCGEGLKNIACDTSRTACVVVVSSVMCTGLLKAYVNGVGTSPLNSRLNLRLGVEDKYKVRVGTWIVGTLTSRSRELVEVLKRRKN